MQRNDVPSPFDPETKYRIVKSDTPVNVDGYKINEPKYLECVPCGARVLITPEPTPGVDAINHQLVDGERCPQWAAHTEYWEDTHPDAVRKILDSLHDTDAPAAQPVATDGAGRCD